MIEFTETGLFFILQKVSPLYSIAVNTLQAGEIAGLIVIAILIVLSASVSGSEVAYFSLDPNDLSNISSSDKEKDKRVVKLLEKPRTLLATILIANNLFNVGIIITSYFILHSTFQFSDEWIGFLFEVVIVTFFIVLFGEVIPKVFANNNSIGFARSLSRMLLFFRRLFNPFSKILIRATNLLESRLQLKSQDTITQDDLDQAIDITTDGSSSKEEVDILKGIVKFGNILVKQIMCSRMDIIAIEHTAKFREVFDTVVESGFSRIPVYEDDIDHIRGVLYAKDLLPYTKRGDEFKWHDLIRPAFFVPENKRIEDLMTEFQNRRIHQAIVVDEYGGTAGIITLEDIMEEIIGDIQDEFDDSVEIDFQKIDDKQFIFEGKTQLNDMCKIMKIKPQEFDDVIGDADTIAGLLLEITQKMPEQNDVIMYHNYQFTVLAIGKRRIRQVKVSII